MNGIFGYRADVPDRRPFPYLITEKPGAEVHRSQLGLFRNYGMLQDPGRDLVCKLLLHSVRLVREFMIATLELWMTMFNFASFEDWVSQERCTHRVDGDVLVLGDNVREELLRCFM